MNPKRVWHDWKMVRTDNKQVWLVDEKLQTYDKDWEEVDSDATLETYSNKWEELESDDELYVYDSLEGTDIGSVSDYQWGWEWPFTIVWKNYDGTVLETDEGVEKGATPTYDGATPTKPATSEYTYTFTWWNPTVKPATKDQNYTAQFQAVPIPPEPPVVTYTITWEDYDGTTLATESVEEGQTPVYPSSDPTREGYTFTGWNPVPYAADKNQTYVAQYEPAVVEISSTYLNCFSSKNDQWSDVYYFNLQIPWNMQSINLEFNSQAWELYRSIDINGTTTSDTITDQTVIAAYSDYVDDLFDVSNTAQFTEEQFNHLKDITVAEDTAIYTVAVDPDNSNKYILSKVVGGSTAESFTWDSGYWDVSWEWRFRVVRIVNQVEDLSTVDTYTDMCIQNLCWNTISNYGGQFFSGNVYNFIKYYTLDTEFITFRLHDNSGEYYSAKTYLGEGWATPYVELWHTVTVTTNPDTITNVFDGNTYTITGQEATDDIAWILSHTAEESGSTSMSEQDFSRFAQLGVERFQMWNIDVAGKVVSISDIYEGYGKEEYRAYYADAEIMEITTRASYDAQTVAQRYESNIAVYQAVSDYCTQNNIDAWGLITSTQYSDLKAIFETYKWDPIYNYVFNLWSNPSDNDLVFQIIQQREVSNQWEDWNKVEIHKDGNWWFYVLEMNNGGWMMQVWNMSAAQYADFWTAATAIGYDVTNQWYQTMIQWVDFLNLKGAVENNMSTQAFTTATFNQIYTTRWLNSFNISFTYLPANATDINVIEFSKYGCYEFDFADVEVYSYSNGTAQARVTPKASTLPSLAEIGVSVGTGSGTISGLVDNRFNIYFLTDVQHTVTFIPRDITDPDNYVLNQWWTLSPSPATIQVYDWDKLTTTYDASQTPWSITAKDIDNEWGEVTSETFSVTPDFDSSYQMYYNWSIDPYDYEITVSQDRTIYVDFRLELPSY